ncbi:hypothetical protein BC940DRAFT_313610 [Gongronella butleri]|nr:hypothetical protein BC940DRAFT_313610 [Gongronella butleri]
MDWTHELENVKGLTEVIPRMQSTVVDDTLYEKVLTILTLFLDSSRAHLDLFNEWRVLDKLNEVCVDADHDSRVVSMCVRLLGVWIGHGLSCDTVQTTHPQLLQSIATCFNSNDQALRISSLAAVHSMLDNATAVPWIHGKIWLKSAFLTKSYYVSKELCRVYLKLFELREESAALDAFWKKNDPTMDVKRILAMDPDENQAYIVLRALEFAWAFANARSPRVYEYMASTGMVSHLLQIMFFEQFNTRDLALATLGEICEHAAAPLALIFSAKLANHEFGAPDVPRPMDAAFQYVSMVSDTCLRDANSHFQVETGLYLLEKTVLLLKRMDKDTAVAHATPLCQSLPDLVRVCLSMHNAPSTSFENMNDILARMTPHKRAVLASLIMTVLIQLVHACPDLMQEHALLDLTIHILSIDYVLRNNMLVMRCFELTIAILHDRRQFDASIEANLFAFFEFIVEQLADDNVVPTAMTLAYKTLHEILGFQHVAERLQQPAAAQLLLNMLKLKLADQDRDVRDAAMRFIASLFDNDKQESRVSFALALDLPLMAQQQLTDMDAYVRASSLAAIHCAMMTNQGWLYIQQQEQLAELARSLPRFLKDPDAFVRRETLNTIQFLIDSRSCEGIIFGSAPDEPTDQCLTRELLSSLLDAEDVPVLISVCKLLKSLWDLDQDNSAMSKQRRDTRSDVPNWFSDLGGTALLMDLVEMHLKAVRAEAISVIEHITQLSCTRLSLSGDKRPADTTDPRREHAISTLQALDLAALRELLRDNTYQEVFEIKAQSLMQPRLYDDDNLMDCE